MDRRIPQLLAFVAVMMLVVGPAWAIKDPETGVNFPNGVKCGGEAATAAGVGVREATLGVDVYAVVIYVSGKAKGKSIRATDECVKIRAKFVRDVGAGKIKEAWLKGFKKYGAGGANVKKFLSVVKGEMKDKRGMVMQVHKGQVIHKYMGRSVTIKGAKKLGAAIKKIYMGGGSPTPELVKSVKKRRVAKP